MEPIETSGGHRVGDRVNVRESLADGAPVVAATVVAVKSPNRFTIRIDGRESQPRVVVAGWAVDGPGNVWRLWGNRNSSVCPRGDA